MSEKEKQGTLKGNETQFNKGHKNTLPKNDEGHKNETGGNDELKSLIAKYVSEAVNEAKTEWEKGLTERISSEREDAARLATMSSEERAKEEMERRRQDFESERQQYVSERAEFEAAKELAAQNLPVSFARFVADSDEDTMQSNISALKKEYMKAIEDGLSQRLKGSLPRVSKEREQMGDPFLSGLEI